ncbi:MAG TPA: NAD(P)-dependent oxidoreductase [Ruminiclostridium sp.]|nr:NAD(P)-dependent oxidoreductase [Ruminiclostridium sp.]
MNGSTKKVAIVTGSAQGIGYAIAKKLASQGIAVAIADIHAEKTYAAAESLCKEGWAAKGFSCDVSKSESLETLMEQIMDAFGQIDILINNAGILHSTPIPDVTEAEWDQVMAVNLKSVFFACQKALPYLKKSLNPRIINISSLAGRMGGYETGLAYTASKGGIISLTYGLARQLAPFGITVNAVCPGTTETDIIKCWDEAQVASLKARIPLNRLGKPENVASAVAYLASDEAEFITGLLMDVNGGMYFG